MLQDRLLVNKISGDYSLLRDYLPKTLHKYTKYKVLLAKSLLAPCHDLTAYQNDGFTVEIVVVRSIELPYSIVNAKLYKAILLLTLRK